MIVCLIVLFVGLNCVSCGITNDGGGYVYPQPVPVPLPPIQFDEPSTPSTIYLPPFQDDIFPPPAPLPTYLPPNLYPPIASPPNDIINDDSVVIPGLYQNAQPQVRVLNMSCAMDSFFRSMVRVDGRSAGAVVVEDAPETCVLPGPNPNFFRIEMEGIRMSECGVRRCSDGSRVNMCITVRVPTVRSLKLPEDGLVTLQCAPQDNIVSHVKHLRLGPNIITTNARGRSNVGSNVVATGGTQRNFNTRVSLLRKSPGSSSFDQVIQPGNSVQLGEELVLRAVVQDGDGWQNSRIGAVMVRGSSSQRSVTLVEDNGCCSANLRSICTQQPRQISPLMTQLNFRAFLFQGARKDEEMLLSVRMLACLHPKDCYQRNVCESINGLRLKRDADQEGTLTDTKKNTNYTNDFEEVTNWESLQFRVLAPSTADTVSSTDNDTTTTTKQVSKEFIILTTIFCLLLVAILIVYVKSKLVF